MIYKQMNRLLQLDQLIRQRRTGNAEELAEKLQLGRRQVYNWLDELKGYGMEMEYDRDIKSFVYLKSYQINFSIKIKDFAENGVILQKGL